MQVVESVASEAGIPPPNVYEIPCAEMNAFATGWSTEDITVAITSGLRQQLSEEELQAVIAHEIGHVYHADVRTSMHIAVVVAGLSGVYQAGQWVTRCGVPNDDEDLKLVDTKSVGWALMGVGMILQVGSFFLRMWQSRTAEYEADAFAKQLCGPNPLISALKKIDSNDTSRDALSARGAAFSHAYISNSRMNKKDRVGWKRWLCTHPTLEERVSALQDTSGDTDNGVVI